MDEKRPLVSIIIRTKDRPKLLNEALESVAAQTYRPIEVVLVNDRGCALDIEEIGRILSDIALTYVKLEKAGGRPHAANVGIDNSHGDYIGFLDDDDLYYESHIESLVDACRRNGAQIAYSSVQAVGYDWKDASRTEPLRKQDSHLYNDSFDASRLLFENYIPFNGLLFSREVICNEKIDERLLINEDWDLLIRLSRKHVFVHVPEVSSEYRLFPKEEVDGDGAAVRRNIHAEWFITVFDKHCSQITGKDWNAFYRGFLIPRHEKEISSLRALVKSEQERLNSEIEKKAILIREREEAIARLRALEKTMNDAVHHLNDAVHHLGDEIRMRDEQIADILMSESWKVTAPLRWLGKAIRYTREGIKYTLRNRPSRVLKRAVVEIYHSHLVGSWIAHFPPTIKQKVKAWLLARDKMIPAPTLSANPRVSIIIPVFNHADHLEKCIRSATEQDYENIEVILVDDKSTDPRVGAILKGFRDNPRVKLFYNERNTGISEAQNRAIIESTGEIIAFLDCDDYLAQDAVSVSLKHWGDCTVYLHTARTNIDVHENVVQRISFEHLPRKDYFSENLEKMYATHFKMIRKDVFSKVGLFDPRFDSAQDYDMLMRIAFHYPTSAFVFVPKFVYFHRLHDRQESSNNEGKQLTNTTIIQNEARLRKAISEGRFDKFISIIMLSYGKCEQTLEAVQSIVNTVKIPFEIVLFDNASDDETVDFLKSEVVGKYPCLKAVFNEKNLGPAAGRREALRYAMGPYYIIFDNDEIAEPGWIEELLVRAESSPEIGAVVARVFFPDNKLQFSGAGVRMIDDELIDLMRYDSGKSRFDVSTAIFRDCGWLPIGATLFKVTPAPYLHAGYQNIFEDAAVSFALKERGYRLVNAPASLVLHNHFMFRENISMKKKYLKDRYNPEGMLRAVASFYAENGLIIHDEYVWKETGLCSMSREELKKKLIAVYDRLDSELASV